MILSIRGSIQICFSLLHATYSYKYECVKHSLDVRSESSDEWVEAVMADFPSFLQDHADCERKASGMAMSLVAKYPNRTKILPDLIATGVEELEHFQQVYEIMEQQGIQLRHEMQPDLYVKALLALMDSGLEARFRDRLLLASIIECRGAERFKKVYEALEPGPLKQFYHRIWASEAKHGDLFVKLALEYFPEDEVYARLDELLDKEKDVLDNMPVKAALH